MRPHNGRALHPLISRKGNFPYFHIHFICGARSNGLNYRKILQIIQRITAVYVSDKELLYQHPAALEESPSQSCGLQWVEQSLILLALQLLLNKKHKIKPNKTLTFLEEVYSWLLGYKPSISLGNCFFTYCPKLVHFCHWWLSSLVSSLCWCQTEEHFSQPALTYLG